MGFGAPARRAGRRRAIGRAANRHVTFSIVMAVLGLVVALVFFFAFFLPQWNRGQERFERDWNAFPRLTSPPTPEAPSEPPPRR